MLCKITEFVDNDYLYWLNSALIFALIRIFRVYSGKKLLLHVPEYFLHVYQTEEKYKAGLLNNNENFIISIT